MNDETPGPDLDEILVQRLGGTADSAVDLLPMVMPAEHDTVTVASLPPAAAGSAREIRRALGI
jgi:hypothetical protein